MSDNKTDAIIYLMEQMDVLALAVENLSHGSPVGARRTMKEYKSTEQYLADLEILGGLEGER
jgi:hypothetical protein